MTNAVLAGLVFLISFIVYALTVQRSIPFWDCGEFIACSYILGIPHPPGTPLFILIGRVFSIIPFVEDISHRINYISVITSAFTAMFSYLLIVRIVGYFFDPGEERTGGRFIAYVGGIAGSLLVAFSATNWGNSVEAEVYGMALALSVAIVWLALKYWEQRGTHKGTRTMLLALYLALMGVGVHMTVFLVVPICAIFFILKREATRVDYFLICGYGILELLLIVIFADGRGQAPVFMLVSAAMGLTLLWVLRRKIHWGILIAIVSVFPIMESFYLFGWTACAGLLALGILAVLAKNKGWTVRWKTGMAIILVCFVGLSAHLYVPIRSAHNPRIDENNPSRDIATFINFLDRKQYGQMSMVERMFNRRGAWENQLGRHPHMGFWSYFEEQYSRSGLQFIPFLVLGLIGMYVAIRKRMEIGLPFFTLFLLCSLGLILYMNFADGTHYNMRTNDAYLEVRNRDYFFTPAFVFFGIAMGMGISAIIMAVRDRLAPSNPGLQKKIAYASAVLVLIPVITLAKNYHICDRSDNFIPYNYSVNILDSCPPNSILFTSGDNDTFPVWCVQEVYDYRKDIRVVNLSLLNTDWYVEQMKNRYDVPISLTDEQILWYPTELPSGQIIQQPKKSFYDRPRGRQTYMQPSPWGGRVVTVANMLVDDIVIENKWEVPICFSSLPYAESPLNLRERAVLHGLVYILEREPIEGRIDTERGYDLFMDTYDYHGYENSEVYRDDNATGVFMAVGVSALRIYDQMMRQGDTTRAVALLERVTAVYPEYWQVTLTLMDLANRTGDTARADSLAWKLHDTLEAFYASNKENLFYLQDLGLVEAEIGRLKNDQVLVDSGLKLMSEAFMGNPNSSYAFRKLVTALSQNGRYSEMQTVARQFAEYKVNLNDALLQRLLGMENLPSTAPPTSGGN